MILCKCLWTRDEENAGYGMEITDMGIYTSLSCLYHIDMLCVEPAILHAQFPPPRLEHSDAVTYHFIFISNVNYSGEMKEHLCNFRDRFKESTANHL